MITGTVTKLVISFGSGWGLVRPSGDWRELFFNRASLARPADFADLEEGQEVNFEEQLDQVTGTRAVGMTKEDGGP